MFLSKSIASVTILEQASFAAGYKAELLDIDALALDAGGLDADAFDVDRTPTSFVTAVIDKLIEIASLNGAVEVVTAVHKVISDFALLGVEERRYLVDANCISGFLKLFIESRAADGGPGEGYRIINSPVYGKV